MDYNLNDTLCVYSKANAILKHFKFYIKHFFIQKLELNFFHFCMNCFWICICN